MSVNLSGNQSVEQINAESTGQIKEVQVAAEYNRNLEIYKSTMATFNPGSASDEYASTFFQGAKTLKPNSSKKTKEPSNEQGAIAKATDWIANLLGVDLNTTEDPFEALQTYDEVMPGAGFSRTTKEYQMMLEAFNS